MRLDTILANAYQASTLLKAMSNQRRLLILCHLTAGEKSVGELERLVGLSQSALSQHLARLRRQKVVRTRRQAQTIFYSIADTDTVVILDALGGLFALSGDGLDRTNGADGRGRDGSGNGTHGTTAEPLRE
ncbi:MAG TPA: metalloregulator ArsR/SmtB family transcription factor [Azospirillaceae bacterium]|nr:metalloregulator ArsR/SmtB family transcription factor [Azospirillaceae bacterium]